MKNDHRRAPQTVVCVHPEKLESFVEPLRLRDVKAKSLRPSITFHERDGNVRLMIRDRFLMRYEYKVTKGSGERFVEATGDGNAIHTDDDIVAGAMTTSKILLPLEILTPDLDILSVKVKFAAPAFYDKRTVNIFWWQYTGEGGVRVDVKTYQDGEVVAKANVWGSVRRPSEKEGRVKVRERRVNKERLSIVKEYFDSLQIDSEGYFQKEGYRDYTYPLAYLASLPSAEMVRQLNGDGGVINSLRLHFDGVNKLPIVGRKGPEVKLSSQRKRQSFNKIVAEIVEDLITFCRGAAIVNPNADMLR